MVDEVLKLDFVDLADALTGVLGGELAKEAQDVILLLLQVLLGKALLHVLITHCISKQDKGATYFAVSRIASSCPPS